MGVITGGQVITGGKIIEGASEIVRGWVGAPSNGTASVQSLNQTGTPTGGTYRLAFMGEVTAPIAYNANAAAVQAALNALETITDVGGVTVADAGAGAFPFSITFGLKRTTPLITVAANNLTGGTAPAVAVTQSTAGVEPTALGAPATALLRNVSNGDVYHNTGTDAAPVWTKYT